MALISVVIPTRNRCERLLRTLAGIARQDPPPDGFEIVVADDGSEDGSAAAAEALGRAVAARVSVVRGPRRGPAAARNRGAAAADGDVLLFLGDDTVPASPTVVAAHAHLHHGHARRLYAVLGLIEWAPGEVTPLMRWLDRGEQFGYQHLRPGAVPASRYLYSSHVSLKRELFAAVSGFDERFPYAAVEDTELGVRLQEAGAELDFRPELVVHHDHPVTLEQSLRRAERVGRSAALYNGIHPDRPHPQVRAVRGARRTVVSIAARALRDARIEGLPGPAEAMAWRVLHREAYARGYHMGPPEPA